MTSVVTPPGRDGSAFFARHALTGFERNLTPGQMDSLIVLKNRILESEYSDDFRRDPHDGDRLLLQFLRATMSDKRGSRVFDHNAAYDRLVKTLQWRRDYGIDEIRFGIESGRGDSAKPDGLDVFTQMYPAIDCIDETTDVLIRFQRFGQFIASVDFTVLTQDQWIRCCAHECLLVQHKLRELSAKLRRDVSTYYVVTDMKHMSFMGVVQKLNQLKMIASVVSDHFPETMEQTFLINCPWVFPATFTVARPFLDKDVVAKFVITKSVPEDDFQRLLRNRRFPVEYGGNGPCVLPPCQFPRHND